MKIANQNKIKLLHLITGLSFGGAEKVVLDLASQMDSAKFEVWVMAIGTDEAMLPQFEAAGVKVQVLKMTKTPASFFQTVSRIKNHIREQQIELIHAHLFHGMLMAGLVKMIGAKVKIVFTPHSVNMESRMRELLLRWMRPLRVTDILFSKEMNASFRKANFAVIPNGIDTKRYDLSMDVFESFTFLAVGRFSPEKNFSALVELAAAIPKRYTFQILIAGVGKEWKTIEQAIKTRQLDHRIQLLGLRKDIPELCNQVHVFLLPSLWEGFPIVLLEAGAAGLPIIASNVGAIGELLDETCAYLVDLNQFETTMCKLMDDYPKARKKGQLLQMKVRETFDLSIIVEQHQELYCKLLGRD